MTTDPFEQFERSRSGFLIPIGLFLVGAVLTWLAIASLNAIVLDADETAASLEADAQERAAVMEELQKLQELQEALNQAKLQLNDALQPNDSTDTVPDTAATVPDTAATVPDTAAQPQTPQP